MRVASGCLGEQSPRRPGLKAQPASHPLQRPRAEIIFITCNPRGERQTQKKSATARMRSPTRETRALPKIRELRRYA